jgi:hypothetical protein
MHQRCSADGLLTLNVPVKQERQVGSHSTVNIEKAAVRRCQSSESGLFSIFTYKSHVLSTMQVLSPILLSVHKDAYAQALCLCPSPSRMYSICCMQKWGMKPNMISKVKHSVAVSQQSLTKVAPARLHLTHPSHWGPQTSHKREDAEVLPAD